MRQIIWLDSAVNDITRLRKFIAEKNPNAAKKAAEAIKSTAEQLTKIPEIGKPVKDLPQYRDLLIRFGAGGYVMRYHLHIETVYIIHIRHYREFDFA